MRSGIYCVMMIMVTLSVPALAYDWTTNPGNGTSEKPYQISTPEQLMSIGANNDLLDKHYILTNDIIFDPNNNSEHVFTQALIAPDTSADYGFQGNPFTGCFDGAGYIVQNFKIVTNSTRSDYLGLFGLSGNSAVVKNLVLDNAAMTGTINALYAGTLCGYNYQGTIKSCSVTGAITGLDRSSFFGGLCGTNDHGRIEDSFASVSIMMTDEGRLYDSGGLCGVNSGSMIGCHAAGDVIGGISSEFLGGFCGQNYNDGGEIIDCSATGDVIGTSDIGGFCGNSGGRVTKCYSSGRVNGWERVGGLCGSAAGFIADCHATGDITGADSSTNIGEFCGRIGWGSILNCYAAGTVKSGGSSHGIGGLCGMSYGTISDCYSSGSLEVEGGSSGLGGLCGVNQPEGIITNCRGTSILTNACYAGGLCGTNLGLIKRFSSTGSVIGNASAVRNGGLCGESGGVIIFCYSTCDVSGQTEIGGLCGLNTGTIENCFATGSVNGSGETWYLGGLCGNNNAYETNAAIINCYSTGSVASGDSSNYLGGLCGCNNNGTIENSFWNVESSGVAASDGGTPLDDLNMMMQTNFIGWDFLGESANGENDIWRMCANGVDYPRLSWEFAENGDFACGDGVDLADLQALAEHWLLVGTAPPAEFNDAVDANGDGQIDLADFDILSKNWPSSVSIVE